jgi:hypothetical protein
MRTRIQREPGQIAVYVNETDDPDDWRVWSTFTLDKTDALWQANLRARNLRLCHKGWRTRIVRPTSET